MGCERFQCKKQQHLNREKHKAALACLPISVGNRQAGEDVVAVLGNILSEKHGKQAMQYGLSHPVTVWRFGRGSSQSPGWVTFRRKSTGNQPCKALFPML